MHFHPTMGNARICVARWVSLLLISVLAGSVLAVEELDTSSATEAQHVMTDAVEFAKYFPQLSSVHFQDHLAELFQRTGPSAAQGFYSAAQKNEKDAQLSGNAVQGVLKELSEQDAYGKITALKTFLINVKPLADLDTVNSLRDYGRNNLLNHFLTNVAKMDGNVQSSTFGTYGKAYRSLMLGVNALIIHVHNRLSNSSKLALNHLSILDPFELKRFRGFIFDPTKARNISTNETSLTETLLARLSIASKAPASVNWVTSGAVGPVLNQGSCGSCWAFAAAAVLESRLVVSGKGNLTSLSEQQLTSCVTSSNGCQGGTYEAAWDYVQVNGLVGSQMYPYTSEGGQDPACVPADTEFPVVTDTPYPGGQAPVQNEQSIMNVVASGGPIAISIATPSCFTQYSSGVLTEQDCPCYTGPQSIDHAVVIVGYSTDSSSISYFLVRNSWGPNWGSGGYVMLQMGVPNGMCGLLTDPNYPRFVGLSPQCQVSNPPSYCAAPYIPGSSSLPVWAWVLIGIAIAIGLLLILCMARYCYLKYKNADNEGYRLLSKEEAVAGKAPFPNSDPRAFAGQQGAGLGETTALSNA